MKTISDNLKKSLAKKTPVYKKTVYLYKRFWNGTSYIYDSPVDITDEVVEYGDLLWKLDNENFNVWNLSNTTLVLRNDRNQWLEGNPKGLFTSNYIINQSKIKIKVGAELADGTIEDLYAFSGYISGSPNFDIENKRAIITLVSAMSIFDKFNAEDISNKVIDEKIGSNSGTEFTTANKGVGIVIEIKKGSTPTTAIKLKANIDYSLNDLNEKSKPLKVTLITGLTEGENLYISYKYWYTDKTIEWVIEQIMSLCGISSYFISNAVFESDIKNMWRKNKKEDWELGSWSNLNLDYSPDSVRLFPIYDDFSDGNFDEKPEWTITYQNNDYGSASIEVENNKLKIYAPKYVYGVIKLPSTKAYGAWQVKVTSNIGDHTISTIYLIGNNENSQGLPENGYRIDFNNYVVSLVKIGGESQTLISFNRSLKDETIRITRTSDGLFTMYILRGGGSFDLCGTATDNTYTTSEAIYFIGWNLIPVDSIRYLNYISFSENTDFSGVYISDVKDLTADITSLGNIIATYSLNDGSIKIETYTSGTSDFSADNDPQGWVAIDATGQIKSAVKRYIKVRITFTSPNMDRTPVLDKLQLFYYTSTTLISLVNLTDLTCRQVLEILAAMPNYEIAFDTDDKFYFRPRRTSVPAVLEIKGEDNLKSLVNFNYGIDRVYNYITATFGDYTTTSDASSDSEPNSITKYGIREYSISSSQLLPSENANIAYAIAPTILSYTKKPRKRCQIETQFLPQLELGDKVKLFFEEPSVFRLWRWGDTDVVYGQSDIEYYNEDTLKSRYNFWNIDMRIEGIRLNLNDYITNFDLVEEVA